MSKNKDDFINFDGFGHISWGLWNLHFCSPWPTDVNYQNWFNPSKKAENIQQFTTDAHQDKQKKSSKSLKWPKNYPELHGRGGGGVQSTPLDLFHYVDIDYNEVAYNEDHRDPTAASNIYSSQIMADRRKF